jgi:hypothetical protein
LEFWKLGDSELHRWIGGAAVGVIVNPEGKKIPWLAIAGERAASEERATALDQARRSRGFWLGMNIWILA